MKLTYNHLNFDEVVFATKIDYLVSVGAFFSIVDATRALYSEPDFPVVELARELHLWLRGDNQDQDFEFNSMSFEEIGAVRILQTREGWVFGSVFGPDAFSAPIGRRDVDVCVKNFIHRIQADLRQQGIDPVEVVQR